MKKILVWDGDETLWTGTAIEVGVDGVKLPDSQYKLCEELFNRGVVQSIASFNRLEDVEAILHRLGLSNFFLIPQAEFGGRSKADMLTTIKDSLGISKYSDIVFVDDNQHNLAEVNTLLPEVITALPEDMAFVVNQYFTKDSYTEEDRNRVRMYRAEVLRKESGMAFGNDKIAFLHSLGLQATLSKPTLEQMPRVVQLVERANKLAAKNQCMWDSGDLSSMLTANIDNLVILSATDMFGDYGISGVLMHCDGNIDLLIISCRLQGKGLGSAFIGTIINQYIGKTITARWKETQYNAGVRSLYEWYKFTFGEEFGMVKATKSVTESVKLPEWVEVITNGI